MEGGPPPDPPPLMESSSPTSHTQKDSELMPQSRSWVQVTSGVGKDIAHINANFITADQLARIKAATTDRVVIDPIELQESINEWHFSLIGKFLTRPPPLHIIKNVLSTIWPTDGNLDIIDLPSGFFLFKFSSEKAMLSILSDSPWTVRGLPLNLMRWRPNFNPMEEMISTAPVWVHFHNLPIEYWKQPIFLQIASRVGRPLKLDDTTLTRARGQFAEFALRLISQNHYVKDYGWVLLRGKLMCLFLMRISLLSAFAVVMWVTDPRIVPQKS
uniref:DUF4283 domain-containing protein n=1 Tax=Ananas comosus var. bracteatus TaxID=296719 RepID=A0A6V7P8A4_ANACO|nr:unnamed protein product [Ananas comosus var. bracteatus]